MGLLNARPKLAPGEALLWRALANHVGGPSYIEWGMTSSSGGQLLVTDRRVSFLPSRVDGLLRHRSWERPLDAVEGVEIVERGLDDGVDVYGGTLRNCLGIRTAPGVELFVVSGIERQIVQLEGLLGSNR